jgi:hypothetical protein
VLGVVLGSRYGLKFWTGGGGGGGVGGAEMGFEYGLDSGGVLTGEAGARSRYGEYALYCNGSVIQWKAADCPGQLEADFNPYADLIMNRLHATRENGEKSILEERCADSTSKS